MMVEEYGITLVLIDDSVDRDRLLELMVGEASLSLIHDISMVNYSE